MAGIYVNVERLKELDIDGEALKRIKAEVSDLYALSHYKELATETLAALNTEGMTAEDIAAEIAKAFYISGYMDAVSEYADKCGEILGSAIGG